MILRDYQVECVEAIWSNLDKHSVACLPTGAGKSAVLCELIRRFMEYPDTHLLLLTHKRELIRQNVETLSQFLPPQIEVGIYCAGLRQKRLRQVTVASVQSLIRADDLPPFELILIDEAHLVPKKATGQYHDIFAWFPDARIIGLTATPFRMDGGLLHKGNERLFDSCVYEAKTSALIKQGWLSPVITKATTEEADLSDVHLRGGEYKPDEMIAAMDQARITQAAVQDVLTRGADRTSILVFASGVEHAGHVVEAFKKAGQNSIAIVTEKTPMRERDATTESFKNKSLRILVNVGCFTTGFDAPNVDCIVMLRATKSPGLYMQILGRGLRKAEGKKDCLLLDYGSNIETHGPIDMITVASVEKGGEAVVKTCPQCESIIFAGFKICPDCGFIFPLIENLAPKHGTRASTSDPIAATVIKDYDVLEVSYRRHQKMGKPDSLRVEYRIGIYEVIKEYVCPEHGGFASQKASSWFARRGVMPMPKTVTDALDVSARLQRPSRISVKRGQYDEILRYEWKPVDIKAKLG